MEGTQKIHHHINTGSLKSSQSFRFRISIYALLEQRVNKKRKCVKKSVKTIKILLKKINDHMTGVVKLQKCVV